MNFFSRDAGAKLLCLALLGGLLGLTRPLFAAEVHILALQQVTTTESPQPSTRGSTPGLRLRLAGAGRPVDLLLAPNTDLLPRGRWGATEAFRGALPGVPGSWTRLTRRAGRYQGLYFDGTDLYAVDTAANAARGNAAAAALAPTDTVVYRLADLTIGGALFAGDAVAPPRSGQALYAQLAAALAPAAATTVLTTQRLDVALVADADQVALDGVDTEANAIARLSIVDGIFSTQLGVQLRVAGVTTFDAATEPFFSTDPTTLLDQLRALRSGSATQQASGLTHLFTGRQLDGQTVGISYVASLCSPTYGAGLSEARTSIAFDALIAAHEIGHNFGAPHDGDPAGACAATSDSLYIMAPKLTGSSTFSPCSLQVMGQLVAGASCLAQINAADAALAVPAATLLALDQATTVSFTVRSVGNAPVTGVSVSVQPPPGVTVSGGGAIGGNCVAAGGNLSCSLGTLAVEESREVQLSLTATQPGDSVAVVQLTADNDGLAQNNRGQLTLSAVPGADLATNLTADSASVVVGQGATLRLSLRNLGLNAVPDAQLKLALPAGLSLRAVSATGLACALVGQALQCDPASLGVDAQASVTLALDVTAAGALTASVNFSSATLADPQPGNNLAALTFNATANTAAAGTSSGGGGTLGAADGALLGLWLLSRLRRRATRPSSP